jgi:two-component system sensor histidine kinase/response regulator
MQELQETLNGYRILEKIYDGSQTLVYRGQRSDDLQSVIIKVTKNPYPTQTDLAQFRHQYAILQRLEIPGVIKAYSLEQYRKGLALILEDCGSISLNEFITNPLRQDTSQSHVLLTKNIAQHRSLSIFFTIALQLTEILDSLYRHKVIHKDIKPENILIHPTTLEVKLIDFSIASCLVRENQSAQTPNLLEGTLAYMSPEQTGRMNRGIDYRTDFYSLGITFYKLLTGQLPFQTANPLDLIHQHIAGIPTPPNQLNLEMPLALNQIILKLMAKMPEDRYQSTYGLQADLLHCQSLCLEGNASDTFELGIQDISDHFAIPEKLYGREQEVEALLSTFNRVAQGNTEVILLSGLSGIGKTALVQEIHKPIALQGGYFISGKFEQLRNNVPLSGFVQALQGLIQQLLTESKQDIETWQTKILQALGENSQVLIEVLPDLELLIGKQPLVPALDSMAAQNRFNFLFQRFIQVFPDEHHPLVLFLDDLQWADFASLQLLQSLLTQSATPYLLVIGTYRSEEVSSAHPLQLTIDGIKKAGVLVNILSLNALKFHNLVHLISDTLSCQRTSAKVLAQVIYHTSNGNPFFSIQLLKSFYSDGLLFFNGSKRVWEWNLYEIQALSPDCDVVKFVETQIKKLSLSAQNLLQIAACDGTSFLRKTLENVLDVSSVELQTTLWEALQSGLIISNKSSYSLDHEIIVNINTQSVSDETSLQPSLRSSTDDSSYYFVHDRVQQAACALMSENQQKSTHLKIGYYILNSLSPAEQEENVFEIMNHLNIGIDYIENDAQCKELAHLNWIAGGKAKLATAYKDALRYFMMGIKFLGANAWTSEYKLTLKLFYGAAEVALILGDYESMEYFLVEIEAKAEQVLDQAKAFQLKIDACQAQGQIPQAISIGLSALNLLGIQIPEQPTEEEFQILFHETQLAIGENPMKNLVNLPRMTSPKKLVIAGLLGRLIPISYSYNPIYFSILVFKLIKLFAKHGNCSNSSWIYIAYGILLCLNSADLNIVYEFGKTGEILSNNFSKKEDFIVASFAFNSFIKHWRKHLKETLNPLRNNYISSLEVGDSYHASCSLVYYVEHSLCCGNSLIDLENEFQQYYDSLLKLNQETTRRFYEIYWQTNLNLTGEGDNPKIFDGRIFNEFEITSHLHETNNRHALFLVCFYKLYLCYLFDDFPEALLNAELAEVYLDSVSAKILVVLFHFYRLLTLLALYANKEPTEQVNLLEDVAQQSEQLKKWAESAPMNFLHKYYLVKAEQHRVLGEYVEAMTAYDQSISLAQEHEYVNEEALAYELAGRFYLGWGKKMIAQTYLINAYYAYDRWGAKAKLCDLERSYPDLLRFFHKSEVNPQIHSLTTFSENVSLNSSKANILDWASVMRASQALSQEIDLDKLLATIMEVAIQNAGAEKGSLLLTAGEELVIKAHYTTEASSVEQEQGQLLSVEVQCDPKLPTSIINFVERMQQPLILANAALETRFASDSYIKTHRPRSILCMPIQRQGRLVGILYLENNLVTEAFTTDRIEVLQLLTAQAAISLENAQLYASVEQKVKDRTVELQAAKQEAEIARETAEKANRAKSDFLANMSHELRTPLNAVLGFSQILHRDPQTSPDQRHKLSIINRSGAHLLTLINDVLTMSKIEAGRTTLNETKFDLHTLILSVYDMLSIKANEKNLKFEVECSLEKMQIVQTDEGKLRQVLINLVSNAIKFTQQGSVILRVNTNLQRGDGSEPKICPVGYTAASLHFEVEDTGAGIAPDELENLFEAFVQTESGRQSQEGTGLGLPISRTFVQLMGGEILVKSTLGQGSCFTFDIQVYLLDDASAPSEVLGNVMGLAPDQMPYRILVAEDRWENQQVVVQLLEAVGFETQVAYNGEEAIALYQATTPHLVLMDLQMPVMDGYEAMRQIKQQAAHRQQQPPIIIAITANTLEEIRYQTLEIGFDDFVNKPFQAENLFEIIAKHLGVRYLRETVDPVNGLQLQNQPNPQRMTLTAADFQGLPSDWRSQVYRSALELDESHLAALIDDVRQDYPAIAAALRHWVEKLDFEKIIELVEPSLSISA